MRLARFSLNDSPRYAFVQKDETDGKDYLISYNDCCGKTACGRCLCNTNERERPAYRMGVHNDINWCMSNDSTMFHCTLAAVVGVAEG